MSVIEPPRELVPPADPDGSSLRPLSNRSNIPLGADWRGSWVLSLEAKYVALILSKYYWNRGNRLKLKFVQIENTIDAG